MSQKDPRDLELAREFLGELSARLNVDPVLMEQTMPHLLGMTKRVAHGVVRPAAPLAAFLVGYVAAQGQTERPDADQPDVGQVAERVRLALEQVEALIEDYKGQTDGQA